MTLVWLTAAYLERAGIGPGDPGLVFIRGWNAAAYARRDAALEATRPQLPARPGPPAPPEPAPLRHTATDQA